MPSLYCTSTHPPLVLCLCPEVPAGRGGGALGSEHQGITKRELQVQRLPLHTHGRHANCYIQYSIPSKHASFNPSSSYADC